MMVETEGFEETFERLQWIKSNWDLVTRFVAARYAERLAELMESEEYLHLIRIEAPDQDYYGVSIEPEIETLYVESLADRVFLLVLPPTAPGWQKALIEHNPWVYDHLPLVPDGDQSFYYVRSATEAEKSEVRQRNQKYFEDHDLTPVSVDTEIPVQDDVVYNQARAEFAIGDAPAPAKWRPALQELSSNFSQKLLDELVGKLEREGQISEEDIPTFESRSPQWYSENSEFVELIRGQL